ncbi:hypothetical protein [Flavobacterium sp.]|uniref:hypothetical protein n=1 Tax=Flavobacterium sp. TaxID=239 RepID=UPI002620BE68|nr:hypothetical protein [Flavobacterium sp.]
MKNKLLTALAVLSFLSFASCSSDDSNDTVNNTTEKFITKIEFTSNEDASKNRTLTVNYDNNGRVTTASDGSGTSLFTYEGGNLDNITGSGSQLLVNDVTSTIYDAYEVGEVLEYDNNDNPVKVKLYERDYDGVIWASYTATITYDSKPNPYYHTLDAAGIIDVLDQVELNFSMAPQAEEIVMAKALLPANNPVKIVVKDDETNAVTAEVNAVYQYSSDNYPVSASITEKDRYNNIYTHSAVYTYMQ